MARPCSICNHSQLVPITTALANGTPLKRVAAQFGVAATSLLRHRTNCLGGAIKPSTTITKHRSRATAALAVLPDAQQLGAAYEALRVRADGITQQAEKSGSLAVALGGIRELRGILDAVGKLSGHIGSGGTQVNVQTNVAVGIDASAIQALVQAITGTQDRSEAIGRLAAIVDAEPKP